MNKTRAKQHGNITDPSPFGFWRRETAAVVPRVRAEPFGQPLQRAQPSAPGDAICRGGRAPVALLLDHVVAVAGGLIISHGHGLCERLLHGRVRLLRRRRALEDRVPVDAAGVGRAPEQEEVAEPPPSPPRAPRGRSEGRFLRRRAWRVVAVFRFFDAERGGRRLGRLHQCRGERVEVHAGADPAPRPGRPHGASRHRRSRRRPDAPAVEQPGRRFQRPDPALLAGLFRRPQDRLQWADSALLEELVGRRQLLLRRGGVKRRAELKVRVVPRRAGAQPGLRRAGPLLPVERHGRGVRPARLELLVVVTILPVAAAVPLGGEVSVYGRGAAGAGGRAGEVLETVERVGRASEARGGRRQKVERVRRRRRRQERARGRRPAVRAGRRRSVRAGIEPEVARWRRGGSRP
jgi:hypothetical protein